MRETTQPEAFRKLLQELDCLAIQMMVAVKEAGCGGCTVIKWRYHNPERTVVLGVQRLARTLARRTDAIHMKRFDVRIDVVGDEEKAGAAHS
jgi:hypothetical protein